MATDTIFSYHPVLYISAIIVIGVIDIMDIIHLVIIVLSSPLNYCNYFLNLPFAN